MDEESLRETVKALVKTKQYEKALVEQGYIYYKMKRFRNSLAAFDRAIELDDQSGAAWVGRALALHGLARHQESIATYCRARNLAPQDARSPNGLGLLLIANRQYDSALIALDRAQELDPYDTDIAQSRLIALRKLHRYRQFFHDLIDATLRICRNQREQDDARKSVS